MTVWFFVAKRRNRFDTVDSAWGGGFVLAAWMVALQQSSTRTLAVALLVTLWSARLTSHLARRSRKHTDDPRYLTMVKAWKGHVWLRAYFSIFVLQGVIIWLVSLPIVTNAGMALEGWQWLTVAGSSIWLIGYVVETIADKQLAQFVQKRQKGTVLDTGLWRFSRHPNYFGELVQWWSIGLIAAQTSFGWLGFAGPLLLTVLIVLVSGIPLIEKRRADNKAYQDYKLRTSPLVPWFPKAS